MKGLSTNLWVLVGIILMLLSVGVIILTSTGVIPGLIAGIEGGLGKIPGFV